MWFEGEVGRRSFVTICCQLLSIKLLPKLKSSQDDGKAGDHRDPVAFFVFPLFPCPPCRPPAKYRPNTDQIQTKYRRNSTHRLQTQSLNQSHPVSCHGLSDRFISDITSSSIPIPIPTPVLHQHRTTIEPNTHHDPESPAMMPLILPYLLTLCRRIESPDPPIENRESRAFALTKKVCRRPVSKIMLSRLNPCRDLCCFGIPISAVA